MSIKPAGDPACRTLVRQARVMTLGTADRETTRPWTAPVYFIFRDGRFYFFSNPKSRHIRHLQSGGDCSCSASVFEDSPRIEGLLGVQMLGRAVLCRGGGQAVRTAAAYGAKYGIPVKGENPIDYFACVFHASLYAFIPDEVYFMNNSTGFGHRTPVSL